MNRMWAVSVAILAIAIADAAVAQKSFNRDYLRQALRGAVPPSSSCEGVECTYDEGTAKLRIGLDALSLDRRVRMQVEFRLGTEASKALLRSLYKFGAKYEFAEKQVEDCFAQAIQKYNVNSRQPGFDAYDRQTWNSNTAVTIKSKQYALSCRFTRIDCRNCPSNGQYLEGNLDFRNDF